MTEAAPKGLGRSGQLAVVALVGALAAAAAFVRLTGGSPVTPPQCQAAIAAAGRTAWVVKGDVALFRPARVSQDLSELAFADANGSTVTLSSFAPRAVLVNFWATWCVPCRAEMPALDRLQSALGGADATRRGLVFGLPTTILVDGRGCAIGAAEGGVAWDSADAQALISAAISGS